LQINDSFIIQAPIETVWDFFMDVEGTSRCVPGVQSFEVIDDTNFRGELKVKVGPITAQFKGTAILAEAIPTRRLVASADANDRATRSIVKAAFAADLRAVDGGTLVDYQMDVSLRGRLAQFGSTVFQSTAKRLTAEFVECVQAKLTPGGAT
jgi:carbon monoxide dehydrogenase subunit G